MNTLIYQILLGIVFLTVVFFHLTKKNFEAALAYGVQSLAIVIIIFFSNSDSFNIFLYFITIVILTVKVILAPAFFIKLIQKHKLTFSVSTYLNTPLTLISIAVLTFIAHSQKLAPLTDILPANQALLSLAFSSMLLSLFLLINRKGAFSQILGILSFENSIVAFAIFAGLEESSTLQLGIIFDIIVWLVIATMFVSMLYKHFGSLDVTSMRHLKD